jgi:hypothetical protein
VYCSIEAKTNDCSLWLLLLPGAGVARSIESDVDNLMRLISIANILPKGMYVENAVKVRRLTQLLNCQFVGLSCWPQVAATCMHGYHCLHSVRWHFVKIAVKFRGSFC